MITRSLRLTLAALVALATVPASAQDIDPETGEVYIPPEEQGTQTEQTTTTEPEQQQDGPTPWYAGGQTGQTQPPPEAPPDHNGSQQQQQPSYQATDDSSSEQSGDSDSGEDDHMRVVGNMGIGFMGLTLVPVGSAAGMDTVSAPALGIRYWIGELVGLDIGIGLGYLGGSTSAGMTTIPNDDAFGMVLHAGVPLALFHAEHYKLVLIPEINFGFSTGTAYGAASPDDQGRNGIVFQIGGRVGTEIHFGFMDIPQLSLQASVGLYFDYRAAGLGESQSGAVATSQNTIAFGTTVQGEPWDILLGALTALYYFE